MVSVRKKIKIKLLLGPKQASDLYRDMISRFHCVREVRKSLLSRTMLQQVLKAPSSPRPLVVTLLHSATMYNLLGLRVPKCHRFLGLSVLP